MIGRTNAGQRGGGSWSWFAFIQVTTDANASITAVNPAGNSYTKTADSSGSVIFTVAYPGTYTISETGATSQTVVVADYGVAYNVTIHVPTFDGYLIRDGVEKVSFTGHEYVYSYYQGRSPSIGYGYTWTYSGHTYNGLYVENYNGASGLYITSSAYGISSYSYLQCFGIMNTKSCYAVAVDESTLSVAVQELVKSGGGTTSVSLSGLDSTKNYRFGLWALGNADYSAIESSYITTLRLQ